jgi:AraC-like DNA-binding protein
MRLIVQRRGLFTIHARRDELLVHPSSAVVFGGGLEYRVSHPIDGGDECVSFAFAPELVEEALGRTDGSLHVTRLDPRERVDVGLLVAALERGVDDDLAVTEIALAVLRGVSVHLPRPEGSQPRSHARRRVDRVRRLLGERPEARWRLDALAREVSWSPFHLAHEFRRHTGTTVHRYLRDVRIAAALARIERGEASLATIATDLGFAHHSHLTATFRRAVGAPPAAVRDHLRRGLLSVASRVDHAEVD